MAPFHFHLQGRRRTNPCSGSGPTNAQVPSQLAGTLKGATGEAASSEMAVVRVGAGRDGAISQSASPAARDGLMSAVDAHGAGDFYAAAHPKATQATGAALPFLEEPLTPRTALNFDTGSTNLPFIVSFINDSGGSHQRASSCLELNTAQPADRPPLVYTFYLSPSASTASVAYSLRSSGPNRVHREETQSAMPAPTFDAPADRFLLSSTMDCVGPSAYPRPKTAGDTTQLRPRSAGSGRSEQTASPPIFARWVRRQHHPRHHPHHSTSHHQAGPEKEAHKLKRARRGAAEDKPRSRSSSKPIGRSRSNSLQKRQAHAATAPQMTREEFEALPPAIQRKYFSTLERLRFAQDSGHVDGISQHYDDITNFGRRKAHQDRNVSKHLVGPARPEAELQSHFSASDSSPSSRFCAVPPEAAQNEGYSRETQALRRLRASVILDAADEAVYKRRNLPTALDTLTPPLSPLRNSMDSRDGPSEQLDQHQPREGHVPQSFYESFRWLDEEDDLDLRLFLDDYHTNLRDGASVTKQRPSFRRHLSITKNPFGRRSSVSSSRPATKEATSPTSPMHSPTSSVSHARRGSRALSLISPKHAPQASVTTIDPAAAHYQDPEARLKLRVYLASPQKFDEAVEFGFPSAEVLSAAPPVGGGDSAGRSRGQTKQKPVAAFSELRTFLADEDDDDDDDDKLSLPSLDDPDSPKTPESFENTTGGLRHHARLASADGPRGPEFRRRAPEGGVYAQAPVSSREMTLRMTLTRPDLRAHEDEIYGWQQKQGYQQHNRRPTATASLVTDTRGGGAHLGSGPHKDSLDRFPEVDRWNGVAMERGVMKRIWDRVRRG